MIQTRVCHSSGMDIGDKSQVCVKPSGSADIQQNSSTPE